MTNQEYIEELKAAHVAVARALVRACNDHEMMGVVDRITRLADAMPRGDAILAVIGTSATTVALDAKAFTDALNAKLADVLRAQAIEQPDAVHICDVNGKVIASQPT